jgi:hypothetical protein
MAKALDPPSLYDPDYVAWLDEQVRHLRAGRIAALDVENIVEELEGLVSGERRELENRLEVVIHHLLKSDYQPDQLARNGPKAAIAHPASIALQPEPQARGRADGS